MDHQTFQLLMSRFDNIDEVLNGIKNNGKVYDERISSLEDTRNQQKGIMIGGGTVVTAFAGLISWIISNFHSNN